MIDVAYLKNMSSVKQFAQGSVIIREGDKLTNEMFIILQGHVGVYKNYGVANETRIAELKVGDFFGEMSLFLNKERTATIAADQDVIVLEINRVNAYDFFEKQPAATYSLIKTLCARIEILNHKAFPESVPAPNAKIPDTPSAAPTAKIPNAQSVAPTAKIPNVQSVAPTAKIPNVQSVTPPISAQFFPDGHKHYTLALNPPERGLVMGHEYECPLCQHTFNHQTVRTTTLKLERMDSDLRPRHKGIDTLYYDVLTCPSCFYSAFTAQFERALTSREQQVNELIAPHKQSLQGFSGNPQDINEVFAGMYLALLCAPLCFTGPVLVTAKLWLRLHWLYDDCSDKDMSMYAIRKALQDYMTAYEKVNIPEEQTQTISLIIGELNYRLNDIDTARKFFFQAKNKRSGSAVLARQAEDRLNEIKAGKE